MRDILEATGLGLTAVTITDLRDGVYYADLQFASGVTVSARPSDAIALAIRVGTTIYAEESVLAEAGVAIPDEQENEVEEFKKFLDEVTPEDFERDS